MRMLLWGNSLGVRTALESIGPASMVGIVAASNRPHDLPPIRELAARFGLPLLIQPPRRQVEERRAFVARVRESSPDVFLINAYSMILPADWLEIPAVGAINVHAARLPEYRGANALNWTLIQGERETAVTVHHLDAGVDTGDIILEQPVAVDLEDTALTLRDKLLAATGPLLQRVVKLLDQGTLPRQPQDPERARHWPPRKPEDGRIDWAAPTIQIYNLIRALVAPWPGAIDYDRHGAKHILDTFLPLNEVERLKQRRLREAGRAA